MFTSRPFFKKEPYSIVFRTHSMPVKIKQQHQALPAPEVEFVRSQEDPHRIKHEGLLFDLLFIVLPDFTFLFITVVRPVIQEVHEVKI